MLCVSDLLGHTSRHAFKIYTFDYMDHFEPVQKGIIQINSEYSIMATIAWTLHLICNSMHDIYIFIDCMQHVVL